MEDLGCLIVLIIAFAVGVIGYKAGPCLLDNKCGQVVTVPGGGSLNQ